MQYSGTYLSMHGQGYQHPDQSLKHPIRCFRDPARDVKERSVSGCIADGVTNNEWGSSAIMYVFFVLFRCLHFSLLCGSSYLSLGCLLVVLAVEC